MNIQKKERIAEMFIAAAAILLLLSQIITYYTDSSQRKLDEKLISAMDTQIKVIDIREAMNEHLLGYLVAINPKINEISEQLSVQVNRSFSKEDVIKDYFTPITELNIYFLEVNALNSARPQWEEQSWEALMITFKIENEKISILQIINDLFISVAFMCLIFGFYFYRSAFKASRE